MIGGKVGEINPLTRDVIEKHENKVTVAAYTSKPWRSGYYFERVRDS